METRAGTEAPRTVFIVEDEADHAQIAKHVLRGMAPDIEVRVLSALEGLAAELASAPPNTAVLLDRLIGGVESYPALQRVAAARPDMRVTLVSAWLTPEEAQRARDAGASAATEKPGTLEGWRALFRGILGDA